MKIFNWVQSKFNAKQHCTKKPNPILSYDHKLKEHRKEEFGDWPNGLLAIGTFGTKDPKQIHEITHSEMMMNGDDALQDDSTNETNDHDHRSSGVVCRRGNDVRKNGITKKSCPFLLKMFVCRGGFGLNPTLRDPFSESSRMEKVLMAMLHKKTCPQASSNQTLLKNKYLENRQYMTRSESGDQINETDNEGSKWVKTDSEYIVLEI